MVPFDRRDVLKILVSSSMGTVLFPGSIFSATAASGCSTTVKREPTEKIPYILSFTAGPGWGLALVDRSGKVLQPPNIFLEVGRFFEAPGGVIAMAKNRHDHKWGYISGQGEWLTQPQFDEAKDFSVDGLARCWGNSKWGYVDLTGTLRISLRYERAKPFHHGLAAVEIGGKWGYINTAGKVVIEPLYIQAGAFAANGLAPARLDMKRGPCIKNHIPADTGPEWGYIDRTGKMVIPTKFTGAEPFGPGGLAPARESEKWGLIDAEGKWVVAPQYSRLEEYNADGFAYFVKADRVCGYLTADGKEAIKTDGRLSEVMQCGMVRDSYYNIGFYNGEGALAIPKQFDWVGNFNTDTGLAVGRLKGVWGLLRLDGQFTPYEHREPRTDGNYRAQGVDQSGLSAWRTQDGAVEWLDADGRLRFRIAQTGNAIVLADGSGKTIWQSEPGKSLKLSEGPWFEAGTKEFFSDVSYWEGDIVEVARKLLREPARRFVPYSLVFGEERDPYDLSKIDPDELPEQVRNGAIIVLASNHVDETAWGTYHFISDQRSDAFEAIFTTLKTRLTAAFGEPTTAPFHLYDAHGSNKEAYWRTGDGVGLQLEWFSQSGDGDFEHQILLTALR